MNAKLIVAYKLTNTMAIAPTKKSHGDDEAYTAGFDLYVPKNIKCRVNTNSHTRIDIGVAFSIPKGYMGLVKLRSGFANRTGCVQPAGVIDANYRGNIIIPIVNPTNHIVDIKPGEGFAQMIIFPIPEIHLVEVDDLDATNRGSQGFGSTDKD